MPPDCEAGSGAHRGPFGGDLGRLFGYPDKPPVIAQAPSAAEIERSGGKIEVAVVADQPEKALLVPAIYSAQSID